MSDAEEEKPAPKPGRAVKVEKALSDRSTCRATGEKIGKGEWRVGMDAWIAGRMSTVWQKLLPFLEACRVEYCEGKGSMGTCKKTSHKFRKGDVRFLCLAKEKKTYFTPEAAAAELQPALAAADKKTFTATSFQGLDTLTEDDRKTFYQAFKVTDAAAKKFNKGNPAPKTAPQQNSIEIKQPKAKRQKTGPAAEESPEPKAEAAVPDQDMNEYEKQRAEQILRNRERMKELNLPQLAAAVAPKPKAPSAAPRGLKAKKKHKEPAGPRRESLRSKGIAADGVYVDTERAGGIVTVKGELVPSAPAHAAEPPPPKERYPKGPVDFTSKNGSARVDKAMLDIMQGIDGQPSNELATGEQLTKLQLTEAGLAKVSQDGVVHLCFHPGMDRLLLATGDKGGNVSIWNIDHTPSTTEVADEEDVADDGVLEFRPHFGYTCGVRWAGGSGAAAKLVSASYDGTVRLLDLGKGVFDPVVLSDNNEWSAMDCTADGTRVYVGDKDGDVMAFDARTNEAVVQEFSLHDKKINTLHVEPEQENMLVSSCSDGSVAVWDLRKFGKGTKAVAVSAHTRTCQSAYYAPDGSQRVSSLSRDNTVKIWDGKKGLGELASFQHNNNTGRWISTFRAIWGPASDCVLTGSMGRMVDILDVESGTALHSLSSESMTAIASRMCVHPSIPAIAAATGSGRVHIFR